jgi:hypothetical protein
MADAYTRVCQSSCRFASKEHWLEPHKESRAFKELKAWQAASGIQVGLLDAGSALTAALYHKRPTLVVLKASHTCSKLATA